MQNKQIILFDMDGTLNDSAEGITNGILHALGSVGINDIKREEIIKYIGPPFRQTLIETFGFEPDRASGVQAVMREYMTRRGIYENRLYPKIDQLLKRLKEQGKTVALATAKGLNQAQLALKHFEIESYFDFVGGDDGVISGKSAIIRHVLNSLGVKDKSTVVMVGDRDHDIKGAAQNGIDSIGVLYGYGTREELAAHNPKIIAETVEELTKLLCG